MNARMTIDPRSVDWNNVVASSYRISQTFRYEYPEPITHLRHRLVISPRERHGDQRRVSHDVIIRPDVPARLQTDAFGNDVVAVHADRVDRHISFTLDCVVTRDRRSGAHLVDDSHADQPAYRERRRLTTPDAALADTAADLRRAYGDAHERAHAISAFVHDAMVYTKDETDVFTTAAQAFATRRGVCQDYAHVAISIARASGLAARYVSGHLLGEGATHAWFEIFVPDGLTTRVIALDPTHGCGVDLRYVVIAVGRDYDDVAPTSGIFTGRAGGKLSAEQRVDLTNVTAA